MPKKERIVSADRQERENFLSQFRQIDRFDNAVQSPWSQKAVEEKSKRIISSLSPALEEVAEYEAEFSALEVEKLRDEFSRIRENYAELEKKHGRGEALDRLCPEVFALVRIAAEKTIGLRPFDVQVIGGMLLHAGTIAEQKTGEGKTLTAVMPLVLNALTGEGVHLVTTNSYLTRVGAQWMGPVYEALGLKVGVITDDWSDELERDSGKMSFVYNSNPPKKSRLKDPRFERLCPVSRKEAYQADIVYGANREFGFDHLRDHMVMKQSLVVQTKKPYFAIIDEADSILIDEARTPFIVEAPEGRKIDKSSLMKRARAIAVQLEHGEHYEVDLKERIVMVKEDGWDKTEQLLGIIDDTTLFTKELELVTAINLALQAKELFHRGQDYIVKDSKVVIVDEFTGRPVYDRRYRGGLHEAIEAKEGVDIGKTGQVLGEITLPEYFSRYEKLSGMTGTAATSAEEFYRVYGLDVVSLPTNVEYRATGSNPDLSKTIDETDGVIRIVYKDSDAGEARFYQRVDFPDIVYRTDAQKNIAVLEDVIAMTNKGRPVLIGTVTVKESNKLAQILWEKGIPVQILNAQRVDEGAEIIAQAGRAGVVTISTNMAGRGVDIMLGGNPEGLARQKLDKHGIDQDQIPHENWSRAVGALRENSSLPKDLESETWAQLLKDCWNECAVNRKIVYEAGGLHIIGTQRQMDRRIDDQLMGRSGRQGDPGSSRFYLSLEDEVVRMFGKDKAEDLLEKYTDCKTPIEDPEVTNMIAEVQEQAEIFSSKVREYVRKFGGVVKMQRETIYAQRDKILAVEDLDYFKKVVADSVVSFLSKELYQLRAKDLEKIRQVCENLSAKIPIFGKAKLVELVEENSHAGEKDFTDTLRQEVETACVQYFKSLPQAIHIGSSDGSNASKIPLVQYLKLFALGTIDSIWVEQLMNIERIREGIGLRAIGQEDPFISFQKEASVSYNRMIGIIREEIMKFVFSKDFRGARIQEALRRVKTMQKLYLLMKGKIRIRSLEGVTGERLKSFAALNPERQLVKVE